MSTTDQFRWQAIGRRKTSVARVYLTPGTGKWDVNGRTLGDYFPRPSLVQHIQQSFTATDTLGAFDVKGLKPGNYTLIFTAMGCVPRSVPVTVAGDTSGLLVTMSRE